METKLASTERASFFNVPLDYFHNNLLNSLPVVDKKLIGGKFRGNLGSLPSFDNVIILLPSKALENGTAEGSD
jgi:hypothetical protein